ncbi:unnamed protein product, partial [Ectocarpus sp. 13 AM-2016]
EEGPRDNFGGGGGTRHDDDDDDDADEISRMLAVAGRAGADVESVGRALVIVEEKVVKMQAEVDEAVREKDHLRAENAALEESLCEVADAMSKSLPTRDRVPLAETRPDSVSPAPTNSPLETPHHRLPGEEE